MATNPIVKEAVKDALTEIQTFDADGWKKLERSKTEMQQVTDAATKAAEEEVNLSAIEQLSQLEKHRPHEIAKVISQTLSEHIPSSRIEMIANGFQIPTYRLNFRHENGVFFADITKSGKKFMDSIQLATTGDFEAASALQIASIVVEAVALLLSVVGIVVPEEAVAKVAKQFATTIMESSAVKTAIEALKKIWGSGGSGTSKATAVWELIKALWEYRTHGKVFWQILKGLCSNMSWFDWAKTIAIITATVVAAIASGGAALIAKIALALNSAYEFAKKIYNLNELDEIRKMVEVNTQQLL